MVLHLHPLLYFNVLRFLELGTELYRALVSKSPRIGRHASINNFITLANLEQVCKCGVFNCNRFDHFMPTNAPFVCTQAPQKPKDCADACFCTWWFVS